MSGKAIEDLTRKQLVSLTEKKFKTKQKLIDWIEKPPIEKLSLPQLKNVARRSGMKGFSKTNKAELVDVLSGRISEEPILQERRKNEILRIRNVSSQFL